MTIEELYLAGRILIAAYFVGSGVRHFWVFGDVAAMMGRRGVPLPAIALAAGTAFEIVVGLTLAAGCCTVLSASGLIVFTIASSFIAMDFWNQDGFGRSASINGWMANIAVTGGLLLLIAGASQS